KIPRWKHRTGSSPVSSTRVLPREQARQNDPNFTSPTKVGDFAFMEYIVSASGVYAFGALFYSGNHPLSQ
ncbi:MAG: hypothetical protein ACI4XA_03940, partial [Oscillospiraceae bacterium]